MLMTHLEHLLEDLFLSEQQAEEAMDAVLEGGDPHQTAAFLALLKFRGERSEELIGMIRALKKRSQTVQLQGPLLDIVGTGGDMAYTVNISTGAALVAAASGIPVAKHGNRSISSRSGSADFLEALGIEIEIPPDQLQRCLEKVNMTFLFAPFYHPSLKKLSPIRKGLKCSTAINLLGPLLNPACVEVALIGVAKPSVLPILAETILALGTPQRALVFHCQGLDELSPLGPAAAYYIAEGEKQFKMIDPEALGFRCCSLQDLQGGDPALNCSLLLEAFNGKKGAIGDALALNAGVAISLFKNIPHKEGIQMAQETLLKGKTVELIQKWRDL